MNILVNIDATNKLVFLGINIVNTTFPLKYYYLFDLIVFLVSISSITNRNAYKR